MVEFSFLHTAIISFLHTHTCTPIENAAGGILFCKGLIIVSDLQNIAMPPTLPPLHNPYPCFLSAHPTPPSPPPTHPPDTTTTTTTFHLQPPAVYFSSKLTDSNVPKLTPGMKGATWSKLINLELRAANFTAAGQSHLHLSSSNGK